MHNRDKEKPSDLQDLSNTIIDNKTSEDFLIDICRVMQDNQEYQELMQKPNAGLDNLTPEQKEIRKADNIFTIKYFIAENYEKIKKNKQLIKELLHKIRFFKKITQDQQSTEYAQIIIIEMNLSTLLTELEGEE